MQIHGTGLGPGFRGVRPRICPCPSRSSTASRSYCSWLIEGRGMTSVCLAHGLTTMAGSRPDQYLMDKHYRLPALPSTLIRGDCLLRLKVLTAVSGPAANHSSARL